MDSAEQFKIMDNNAYEEIKKKIESESRIKYLVQALVNDDNNHLLGNTRFFSFGEVDLVVLNKEIGEQIQENIITYYKKEKKFNKDQLSKIKNNILIQIVNKNLLARWSIKGLSKEELITLGIGTFKEETREQASQSVLSHIPILGRLFK